MERNEVNEHRDCEYLVFDTETTGLNPASDQIIEISIQVGCGDDSEIKTRRVKPTIAISPEATAIHGITKEDVKDCPTFKQLGNSIREYFEKATVIVGYNFSFDLQILQAELQRNGFQPIQLHDKSIVDPLNIWRRLRPRKLTDTYKTFCGKDLPDAHNAEADVRATDEVFQAMRKSFDLEGTSIEEWSSSSISMGRY